MRLHTDAGVTLAELARASGADPSYLRRIEAGASQPSVETYARLAAALGADLALRLYPNTGPTIRDRHQARIAEALLGVIDPRWKVFPEVAVRHPSRGWIDLGLHDPRASLFVAVEIQSELRRLEQLIRWSSEKTASLASWDGWTHLGEAPDVSQLLVVRDTRHPGRRSGVQACAGDGVSRRWRGRARRIDHARQLAWVGDPVGQ